MSSSTPSFFSRLEPIPEPYHIRLNKEFGADPSPLKKNYLFGSFRDEGERPYVLPEVKEAELELAEEGNGKERAELVAERFSQLSAEFVLGSDSPALREGRVASLIALSNGNAVAVSLQFLRWALDTDVVFMSVPTWQTHEVMAKGAGFRDLRKHRYWDEAGRKVDFAGMMEDLTAAPEGSVLILQPCGHNPTGIDPTKEQWMQLGRLCRDRSLFPFFDCAYQGFASGDPDADAWSIRHFVSLGLEIVVTQSYGKNFGIYGERCGNVVAVLNDPDMVPVVSSELARLNRSYSDACPMYGARIVVKILDDADRRARWRKTLADMVDKIQRARRDLRCRLESLTGGDWSHITEQIGMFSYTGLTKAQCIYLKEQKKVYIYPTGRMNISALSQADVDCVAEGMAEAIAKA